jgi:Zn-dependent peptidase ImmA (M78 family)
VSNKDYYEEVKALARDKRSFYEVDSKKINLTSIKKIYKAEDIKVHNCPNKLRNLRASYYNDDLGCDVLLNQKMPREAKIFSLLHELKHHYLDQEHLHGRNQLCFLRYDEEPLLELTAEVFAAEFIWPEQNFSSDLHSFGIRQGVCSKEAIVNFQRTCGVPVSYTYIIKRLEWFRIIPQGYFKGTQWKKLEWDMYGKPFYLRK